MGSKRHNLLTAAMEPPLQRFPAAELRPDPVLSDYSQRAGQAVVIDCGSYLTRAGWSGGSDPHSTSRPHPHIYYTSHRRESNSGVRLRAGVRRHRRQLTGVPRSSEVRVYGGEGARREHLLRRYAFGPLRTNRSAREARSM